MLRSQASPFFALHDASAATPRDGPNRILLAVDHYAPHIGGAERQNYLIAHELRRRGYEVAVATVWQNALPAEEDEDGVLVHRVQQLRTVLPLRRNRARNHQPPFPDPITVFALRRLIHSFTPDIVHAVGWFSYSCAVALAGKDAALLISARDYGYGCANRTLLRNGELCDGPGLAKCVSCAGRYYGAPKGWLAAIGVLGSRPLLARKVAGIHSISTYVRDTVRRDFLDDRTVGVRRPIFNVVLPSMWLSDNKVSSSDERVRRCVEALPTEPFILFVGALRLVKGVAELVAAYGRLTSPPPLVLVGTVEPDTPRFPAHVKVLTDFPHAAVTEAYRQCLFATLPSRFPEPLGATVYEAMLAGKAVIGTAPGGHADMVIDGETGVLIPHGDVDALANAMRCLIDDPELRERMGNAARPRAERFILAVVFPQLEAAYRRATASAAS